MINVVCALICRDDGKWLVCQRSQHQSHPGKWEFPGGKVEAGEDAGSALLRELEEELACRVQLLERRPAHCHDYPDFSICLIPFYCRLMDESEPKALEHEQLRWLSPDEFSKLDWAEADIPVWKKWLADNEINGGVSDTL